MKKLNSIFDTESKIIQFMGSNKYIITKINCWPIFKQDPCRVIWYIVSCKLEGEKKLSILSL